jgi:hypothetical protein
MHPGIELGLGHLDEARAAALAALAIAERTGFRHHEERARRTLASAPDA